MFELTKVIEVLNSKREVYLSLIQKVFKVDENSATNIFESEIENFKERAKTYFTAQKNKPTMSVLQGTNIFLEVLHLGLSFSKSADLIYLSKLKGTGTAVGYQPTVRGDVFMATNSGAISHISEPVIVRNTDSFKLKTNDQGRLIAHHEIDFDNQKFDYSKDFKIGYCYITYPNGDREISYTDKVKMDKSYSLSPSQSMYNDITFLQSKVIKRALHQIRKSPIHSQMSVVDEMFEEESNEVEVNNENPETSNTNTITPEASNFDFEEPEQPKPQQPEPQPEPKEEVKPELKPDPKPEPKPEPKEEPKEEPEGDGFDLNFDFE